MMNNKEFLTVSSDKLAVVWRTENLTELKTFKFNFHEKTPFKGITSLHKIDDKIILFQGMDRGGLVILNAETYKIEVVIYHIDNTVKPDISGDFRKLRIEPRWIVEDKLSLTRKKSYKNTTFNLKTREITEGWNRGDTGWYNLSKLHLQFSHTRKYSLARTRSKKNYLVFPNTGVIGQWGRLRRIYHFDDGEMIIFNHPTNKEYFQATVAARKYITMKNDVPINDITFEKYHKKNNHN